MTLPLSFRKIFAADTWAVPFLCCSQIVSNQNTFVLNGERADVETGSADNARVSSSTSVTKVFMQSKQRLWILLLSLLSSIERCHVSRALFNKDSCDVELFQWKYWKKLEEGAQSQCNIFFSGTKNNRSNYSKSQSEATPILAKNLNGDLVGAIRAGSIGEFCVWESREKTINIARLFPTLRL